MNTRREFLKRMTCATAGAAALGCASIRRDGIDPNLTVFLSDIHVVPDGHRYLPHFRHTREQLRCRIDEILAMRPRPARVVTFGDLAFNHGEATSYAYAAPLFDELAAAGIAVTHAMGNHDRRDTSSSVSLPRRRRRAFPAVWFRSSILARPISSCSIPLRERTARRADLSKAN